MSITKRGTGYQATVHYGGGRYRKQCNTLAEAETWEERTKAALKRGELPDMGDGKVGAPSTLQALADLTLKLRWAGTRGERTACINASICIRDIGNIAPARVTTQTIDALTIKWKDEGVADATINRRLSALSTMLRVAHDRGFISGLPKVDRRKEQKGRIRYYSSEEEEKIIAWFRFTDNLDMVDLITVAIDTGMRKGELQRLEGRDVHDEKVHVWFTKADIPRTIPLTKRVSAILEERKKVYGAGKLFPMTDDSIRYAWDTMRNKHFPNDPHAVFHTLRHTFVSRLIQRGANLKKVSELAGHSTITTTMRYSHLAPEDLVNTVRLLETA